MMLSLEDYIALGAAVPCERGSGAKPLVGKSATRRVTKLSTPDVW